MIKRGYAETFISMLTLAWLTGMIFYYFFLKPYPGFTYSGNSGLVYFVIDSQPGSGLLQANDTILTVDGVDFQKTPVGWNTTPPVFSGYQAGDVIPMTVERDGEILAVEHVYQGPNLREFIERTNGQWLIPLFFWGAGMMTLLFVRPRTMLSWLMAMFFYLTSFWLSAGIVSGGHVLWAALAMRVAIWMTIPVYWHFLWYFPTALGRLPRPVVVGVYLLGTALAGLQILNVLPPSLYTLGFVLALAGSLVLIVLHAVLQTSERKALAGSLLAAAIILIPVIVTGLAASFFPSDYWGIAAVTGFSALPGYFFYTLLRRQFARQDKRADRLIRIYLAGIVVEIILSFMPIVLLELGIHIDILGSVLLTTIMVLVTLVTGFLPFMVLPALARAEVALAMGSEHPVRIRSNRLAGDALFFILLFFIMVPCYWAGEHFFPEVWEGFLFSFMGLAFTSLAVLLRAPFQNWFQLKVLGMPLHPENLRKSYSDRILSCLDEPRLRSLLIDEVLPSLLVRQSALVHIPAGGKPETFLALRVMPEQLPSVSQVLWLVKQSRRVLQPDELEENLKWVRLAIPLWMGDRLSGIWIFGERDPEDRYHSDDIEMLDALALTTALALAHIGQANSLRALYQADVDQRDIERLDFARELHDAVLNPLAAMRNGMVSLQSLSRIDPELEQMIQHVRKVVKGLRPEMLNYGLHLGLQNLVSDLEEKTPAGGPVILFEIPYTDVRISPQSELNLFRIVQQACQNAINHAGATTIRVSGEISQDEVQLCIQDDGRGFEMPGRLDLASLLSRQHFGLAGMFERAVVIGADLDIDSSLGNGTSVQVRWGQNYVKDADQAGRLPVAR